MKASSLHSRNDLAKYLSKSVPQLACDYYLSIEASLLENSYEQILVTDFSFPDVGVEFGNGSLGHLAPNFNFGSNLQVTFLVPNKGKSPIDKLFEAQFIEGVPRFIAINALPVVYIHKLYATVLPTSPFLHSSFTDTVDSEVMIKLSGCRFSMPKPSISVGSDSFAKYTVNISFEDFEI